MTSTVSKVSKVCSLLLVMLFISSQSFGQTLTRAQLSSEWQIIAQQDGVDVYVKEQNCDLNKNGKPVIFSMLKIVNTTNQEKSVSYKYMHQYDQGCDGCGESSERNFTVNLEPNAQIEESCDIKNAGLSLSIYNPNVTSSWKFESVSIKILSTK